MQAGGCPSGNSGMQPMHLAGVQRLRDDGLLPVICPTGQTLFCKSESQRPPELLCMGSFSIFWLQLALGSNRHCRGRAPPVDPAAGGLRQAVALNAGSRG